MAVIKNATMSPLPGYNMPSGPTAKESWAAAGTPYGAKQTYFPEGSYAGDPRYFAPASHPQYYANDPLVTGNQNLVPEWQFASGGSNKPGGGSGGSGGGTTNPNTGGGNVSVPGLDPGQGGSTNPNTLGIGGANPGGAGLQPNDPLGLSGSGTMQDYWEQLVPESAMRSAIEGMGGTWNTADPLTQQLNRMSAGLTYLFPLMGGTFDTSQFGGFSDSIAQGLLGQGNSMNFGDLSSVMGNIFGGNMVSDLMFADAYGPQGANAAADIIGSILSTALPTAMPLPLIGGVQQFLEQAQADYIHNYVQNVNSANPMNFIDYLAGTQFGDIFGF